MGWRVETRLGGACSWEIRQLKDHASYTKERESTKALASLANMPANIVNK